MNTAPAIALFTLLHALAGVDCVSNATLPEFQALLSRIPRHLSTLNTVPEKFHELRWYNGIHFQGDAGMLQVTKSATLSFEYSSLGITFYLKYNETLLVKFLLLNQRFQGLVRGHVDILTGRGTHGDAVPYSLLEFAEAVVAKFGAKIVTLVDLSTVPCGSYDLRTALYFNFIKPTPGSFYVKKGYLPLEDGRCTLEDYDAANAFLRGLPALPLSKITGNFKMQSAIVRNSVPYRKKNQAVLLKTLVRDLYSRWEKAPNTKVVEMICRDLYAIMEFLDDEGRTAKSRLGNAVNVVTRRCNFMSKYLS